MWAAATHESLYSLEEQILNIFLRSNKLLFALLQYIILGSQKPREINCLMNTKLFLLEVILNYNNKDSLSTSNKFILVIPDLNLIW